MLITLDACPLCSGKHLIGLTVRHPKASSAPKQFEMPDVGQWNLCSTCCFLFQNPRPSREKLEKYYEESGYRLKTAELIPQGYIDSSPHQLARFHPWLLVNEIDLSRQRGGSCLDFGCGIGGALTFLANQGNECFGVEIDQALAAFANTHYPIRVVPKVEDLPAGRKYNVIFANHAIEHIYDPNDFFAFAKEAIHENGIMVLAVPAWRYSTVMSAYEAFSSEDTSVWDHIAMSNWLNKYGFYMTSFMYQNYGARTGDWELVVTAQRSESKNCYTFSVDEVLAELYGNIKDRCESARGPKPRETVAVRSPLPG